MSQTIQDFYRVAQQRDFARDYQFKILQLGPTSLTEDDLVYIRTATIPDREIAQHDTPFVGMNFNVPGTVSFPGNKSWDVTVYLDGNFTLRKKLEEWQNSIFDITTTTGNLAIPGTDRVITMQTIDSKLNPVNTYQFYGVWCSKLGVISYDRTGTGTPLTYTASLAYQYWQPLDNKTP